MYNRILIAPLDTGGYLMVALYAAALTGVFLLMGAFNVGSDRTFNIILSHVISLAIIDVFAYFQLSLIHRSFLPFYPILIELIAEISISVLWTYLTFYIHQRTVPIRKMILVYGDKKAEELVYKILEREDQYRICESVMYECDKITGENNLKYVEDKISKYSSVIIFRIESSVRNDLLKYCYEKDIEVYLPPRISDVIVRGAKELNQFDSPLIVCKNCSLSQEQRFFKRLFDIVFSFLGIVVLSPLMLIISLAIKLYDGGPVLFTQKRVTLNERIFYIYKFRSMVVNAEKKGVAEPATDNDPRVTPVGKLLRKLRFDELPQLFNILKGDMSIVGPRPERVENHKEYTAQIPEFPFRTKVKAGLTGYAQIMGKYNTSPYDKLILDLIYIQKFSFFLDFRLILLTIKIIFMKESTEGFKASEFEKYN